jgi:hypothetical protein
VPFRHPQPILGLLTKGFTLASLTLGCIYIDKGGQRELSGLGKITVDTIDFHDVFLHSVKESHRVLGLDRG